MSPSETTYTQRLDDTRHYWDSQAASFDEAPDHGLRDSCTLDAWTRLLSECLPQTRGTLLDLGCGTGSLSLVLAGLGYTVTGIDLSPGMIAQAEAKARAAGQSITFHVMDAVFPAFPARSFDVLVCRHLLWALPEPDQVLRRWAGLLKPDGRLLLIEGFWHTGAGLHAYEVVAALPDSLINPTVVYLSDRSTLWGGMVHDERFAALADFRP